MVKLGLQCDLSLSVWHKQHDRMSLVYSRSVYQSMTGARLVLCPPSIILCVCFRSRVRTVSCCSSQPGPSRRSSATPSTPSVCSTTCHTSSNGHGRKIGFLLLLFFSQMFLSFYFNIFMQCTRCRNFAQGVGTSVSFHNREFLENYVNP